MLEHLGARDVPFFVDVDDDDDGDTRALDVLSIFAFGPVLEVIRATFELRDATDWLWVVIEAYGVDGVDHQDIDVERIGCIADVVEALVVHELERFGIAANALETFGELRHGLLATGIQDFGLFICATNSCAHLTNECRLANACIPTEKRQTPDD